MSILFATKVVLGPEGVTVGSVKAVTGGETPRESSMVLLSELKAGLEDEAQEALSVMEDRLRAALFGCGANSTSPLPPKPIKLDADVVAIELEEQGFDFRFAYTWAKERIQATWAKFLREAQSKWEQEKEAYILKCEEELKNAMPVQYMKRRIVVTNIAADATDGDMWEVFGQHGTCSVRVRQGRHRKYHTRIATVQYESEETALHVCQNVRLHVFGLRVCMYYAPNVDYSRNFFDLDA